MTHPNDLEQYLDDHAVTVSQSCAPGWHVYLNTDDECVCIGADFETKEQAESHAGDAREVVRCLLAEYWDHLVDLGALDPDHPKIVGVSGGCGEDAGSGGA